MKITETMLSQQAVHDKETRSDATASLSSNLSVSRCDPTDRGEWSALINQVKEANLGHAPEWFAAIKSAYGHSPIYQRVGDGQNVTAAMPAFFIRSRIFGSVVTSMPFLDTGGPCGTSPALNRTLVDSLVEEAKRLGASRVELRCTQELDLPVPASTDKVSLVLPLCDDSDNLWKQFNAKVRNQIRKAERSGLGIEIGGKEKLEEFYEIFSVNMRDLGSPVHSKGFFASLLDAFGSKVKIVIVRYKSVPIGGLVAIAFKDTVFVPWASSLKQY
ncbi:MAG: aminoacyltransferase, partial [Deltaproteobacteria bacterium]|nr:aminoacyltransferase [Deltaproteobacteria bacterium]